MYFYYILLYKVCTESLSEKLDVTVRKCSQTERKYGGEIYWAADWSGKIR